MTSPDQVDMFEVPTYGSVMTEAKNLPPHTCKCGSRWGGANTAHCAAQCHLTFTSPTAFFEHRRGGLCVDPASAGLYEHTRIGYTAWGYQTDDEAVARLRGSRK